MQPIPMYSKSERYYFITSSAAMRLFVLSLTTPRHAPSTVPSPAPSPSTTSAPQVQLLRALTKPAPKPAPNPVITITQPLPVYPEGESHNFSTNGAATQFFLLSIFSLVVTMVVNYLPDTADEPLLATCDQAEKFVVLVVPTTLRRCVPM